MSLEGAIGINPGNDAKQLIVWQEALEGMTQHT